MDINSLLEELDQLKIPPEDYVITASGSLAIRGIREANDLDVLVTDKVWNDFSQTNLPDKKYPFIITIGNISLLTKGSAFVDQGIATLDELINTAEIIANHPLVRLDYIIKFKTKLGRKKDLKDLELIKKFQEKNI